MRRSVKNSTGLCAMSLLLAACGGGGSSEPTAVGGTSATAPAPAPASSGAPGAAPSPAPASPPAAAGTPAPPSPAPAPAGTPPSATTVAPVAPLSSLPAGRQTGGTTAKTPSGYSDVLLAGRWRQAGSTGSGSECVPIPASAQCNQEYSVAFGLGFTASGLAATRLTELAVFRGASCAPANARGTLRLAEDIAFEAADASLPDATPTTAGNIAVRRGIVTAQRVDTGGLPDSASLFAGCSVLDPATDTDPTECSDATLTVRIEAGPGGRPVLLVDEDQDCRPGTAKPPARYVSLWTLEQDSGLTKLP